MAWIGGKSRTTLCCIQSNDREGQNQGCSQHGRSRGVMFVENPHINWDTFDNMTVPPSSHFWQKSAYTTLKGLGYFQVFHLQKQKDQSRQTCLEQIRVCLPAVDKELFRLQFFNHN